MNYKRFIYRKLLLLLIFTICIILSTAIMASAEETKESDKKIILIDPGHGGYDGGAEGSSGVKEKDINLMISLKLRDKLVEEGYKVNLTREEDKAFLDDGPRTGTKKAQDMANRCKIKKEINPDIFISIHQNHFSQSKYFGAQVWYSKNEKSRILAHIVQQNLKNDLHSDNKRIEKAAKDDYKILTCEDNMPSIIIETGFLSNSEEEQRLLRAEYQQEIAKSITKSIKEYFKNN